MTILHMLCCAFMENPHTVFGSQKKGRGGAGLQAQNIKTGMIISPKNTVSFRREVWRWYRKNRRSFPWRKTRDPYKILVSEVMLQQTQADRVVAFFNRFVRRFPSIQVLAAAPFHEVFSCWQGLGYNRRALFLKRAAEAIIAKHGGKLPKDTTLLRSLPGVGPYTAAAVRAFAWNFPDVLIETNIRTVFIRYFFPGWRKVKDSELVPLIEKTLDRRRPREWYSALMDYGSFLKRAEGNAAARSRSYVKQHPFRGSRRELRGNILRVVGDRGKVTYADLTYLGSPSAAQRFLSRAALSNLVREGLLRREGNGYILT